MKGIWISIIFLFCVQPLSADTFSDDSKTNDEIRQNVVGFRDFLMKELVFPKESARRYVPTGVVSRGTRKPCPFTSTQYNQAAKSDWVKSQVMSGLATLSAQLSQTVGTAFAPQSVTELQGYSVQLQGSSDPDFQQIGGLYQQEAQAIQTGNVAQANTISGQISALPGPTVAPGYQPTSQESALVSAFNQVIGTAIAALGGVIGSLVVSQILSSLGITNLGSLVGLGQSTGSNIATSGNGVQGLNTAGAVAVQTGGSVAIQQLGTVNVQPREPQNSANAGGAPPAQ